MKEEVYPFFFSFESIHTFLGFTDEEKNDTHIVENEEYLVKFSSSIGNICISSQFIDFL